MIAARNTGIFYSFLLVFSIDSTFAWADQSPKEIQERFNAETVSRPFSVPDDASLTASLKAATERGTPTRSSGYAPCFGLGCNLGYGPGYGYGYGSYFGGYTRPYYGGYYGGGNYRPYYYGW